jgi:hypothetical protein
MFGSGPDAKEIALPEFRSLVFATQRFIAFSAEEWRPRISLIDADFFRDVQIHRMISPIGSAPEFMIRFQRRLACLKLISIASSNPVIER